MEAIIRYEFSVKERKDALKFLQNLIRRRYNDFNVHPARSLYFALEFNGADIALSRRSTVAALQWFEPIRLLLPVTNPTILSFFASLKQQCDEYVANSVST